MLNVGKYISVSIFTPIAFLLCVYFGKLDVFAVTYMTMLFHELCHTLAAVCIGLGIDKIILHPFGVNLRLRNKFVHSIWDEIILYMSGPLFNILLALICRILYGIYDHYILQYLYFMNISLFAMNMLPILPLDGGVITKKILSYIFGHKIGDVMMRIVSFFVLSFVSLFCIYSLVISNFNISVAIIAIFLIGSALQGEEKYDVDFVKALMFCGKTKNKRIRHFCFQKNTELVEIAKKISDRNYMIVYLVDERGKVCDIITEREIIDRLT